ncbi:hypothetical protein FHU43_3161 [Halopolyspora algeriensis]|nr:hypothetical protein FHU43_3161 [Halopolyspora algeriensis]
MADRFIADLLADFPALLLEGPRASGKTTTAARHARSVVHLDDPREADVVRADPEAVLTRRAEPVLIDEWQLVPSVLWAIKRAVDADYRPGRFIVTGSVHGRTEGPTWPGVGRLMPVSMAGMTVREVAGEDLDRPSLLERFAQDGINGLQVPTSTPDLAEYVELAVRGGFPEAVRATSARSRHRWMTAYLGYLFDREIEQLEGRRDPTKLRRFFEAYALNTSGIVPYLTLAEAAEITRQTAEVYEGALTDLFLVETVPAWSTNRLKRLVKSPKRYVVDPGLVAGALRLNTAGVLRDGEVLGRLLDTFVYSQLRAETQFDQEAPRLFHLRQEKGAREVDLIAEFPMNKIIGIEVKATATPGQGAAKHLRWLRDELGDQFLGGIVFHTSPYLYQLDDKIVAAPICTLWG